LPKIFTSGVWDFIATRPRVVMASLAAVALLGVAAAAVVRERIAVWHDDLSLWSDVVARSPGIADARYNLGVALVASGDRAEAMRQFQRALELRPKAELESVSLKHLGLLYEEQGQIDVAVAHYEQAVRAWPDNPSANLDLGASLAQLRRFGEAVEHFRTALRVRPDDPRGHYNLGLAYVAQGQLEEGIRELETAVRLQPSDAGFRAELANAYSQRARVPRSPTVPGR
jgi:tetratricopeptide (TPR) repeat protein